MGLTHAQKRGLERYGILLEGKDFFRIRLQVENGHAVKLWKVSEKLGVYLVRVRDVQMKVVYHRAKRMVYTVLPMGGEE